MQQLFHLWTLPQNSAFLICTPLIYIQLTTYELSVQERAITCYSSKTLLLIWLLIRLTNFKVKQAMMFQRKKGSFSCKPPLWTESICIWMIFRTILLNSVCLFHEYREAQDLIIKYFTILRNYTFWYIHLSSRSKNCTSQFPLCIYDIKKPRYPSATIKYA